MWQIVVNLRTNFLCVLTILCLFTGMCRIPYAYSLKVAASCFENAIRILLSFRAALIVERHNFSFLILLGEPQFAQKYFGAQATNALFRQASSVARSVPSTRTGVFSRQLAFRFQPLS